MMSFDEFMQACFEAAKEQGCDEAEVYSASDERMEIGVLDGEVVKICANSNSGLNLRVMYEGRIGYAYTEVLEDVESLVRHAVDNAKVIENDDVHPMQGSCTYPSIEKKPNPIVDMTDDERINIALNLERDILAFDDRVNRMSRCELHSGVRSSHIRNTRGLCADSETGYSYIFAIPIVRQGDEERSNYSLKFGPDIMDYNDFIKETVDNALMTFNAKPVASGEYRVLLRCDAAVDFLDAFCELFFADKVQDGLSLLAGKLNKPVASEVVSIVDDPFEADYPRAFDDEGVPSVFTSVVENGILKSYLYNLTTARKDNVPSTSNAGRFGASSPIGIMPSNFYIKDGEKSYKELIDELNTGLIITELAGLHAGINTVSGDFSLIAAGLLVEGGSIIRAVEQITIAGNILTLLDGILAVGNDLRFRLPEYGRVGSPSLLIDKLAVSGK
ncbi:MAG: TldD/PmbA family protein [Clostridia bacterium]|nr:TldD/PmbA family protein [Clostridia bacterium]